MYEGSTQTYVAAWPGHNDRRAPSWVASFSSYYAGSLAAVTVAILLRLSALTRAMPLGLYLVVLGGAICCLVCGLIQRLGQPSMATLVFRFYRDLWDNSCLWFTFFAGTGLSLGSILIVYSVYWIGLAYTTVFVVTGNVFGGVTVDYFGFGWAQRKVIRPAHFQAAILLILGAAFLQFDLFGPPVQTMRTSGAVAGISAGVLCTLHCAALAEFSPIIGSRARALAITFARFALYLPVWIFTILPRECRSPRFPIQNRELWFLTFLGTISMVFSVLSSSVAITEGATSFTLEFWTAFVCTSLLIVAAGKSSLPPRSLDISHFLGVAFVLAACFIGVACTSHRRRRQLQSIPNRRQSEDSCQVCVKNDNDLNRVAKDLMPPNPEDDRRLAATVAVAEDFYVPTHVARNGPIRGIVEEP